MDFDQAKLAVAVFDRCKLTKAKFVGADLAGTNFEGSIVDHTELDYQGFVQYGNSRGFVMGTG
ncbi:MAG: pentapeptide repeat-containing protein [bacterium]